MMIADTLIDPLLISMLVIGLALVPLLADDLPIFGIVPHDHWLSIAGGASIANVFVHLLPELDERNEALDPSLLSSFEHHAYLVALFGSPSSTGSSGWFSSRKRTRTAFSLRSRV